ncbi:HTH-type transcriptional regulator GbpR [Falsiruegeria litorea R37]|uniref:HTH-type transcriptional regulator GbpR n=1 Tax=Falsiruegeria litorea R37 TaxID=1200284 RepID=A0A1Y5S8K3_9RHOB|nr:LysR family transcriptional regulator [Falsiruegeria litorea]SLN33556.1 HTH-type transcriptional regulator GbpR [Falsiruegeria litorea R37]
MIDAKISAAVFALAKYGNFRAAAEAIGTSPASFSRYIGQAESYAGHTLFERGPNGAPLTPAGRDFLQLLDQMQNAATQFEAGVSRLRSKGPETLKIGCGPLTTRTIIAPILAEMLGENPDLHALINVRATKEPLEGLRMGSLDVAVCDLTHTPDLSDLDILVLRKEPVSFWARPGHPLLDATSVSVADIFRGPFTTAHLHRHWRSAIAGMLGGDPEAWQIVDQLPQIECDDFALVADLACRTDLVAAGMHEDFAPHAEMGRLHQVKTVETMTWNICAARRKNAGFPALEGFWSHLSQRFCA